MLYYIVLTNKPRKRDTLFGVCGGDSGAGDRSTANLLTDA